MERVTVHFIANVLSFKGAERRVVDLGDVDTVGEAVRVAFPGLDFDRLVIVRRGKQVADDAPLDAFDHIVVAYRPAIVAVGGLTLTEQIIYAVVFAVVSYLIQYLLRPKDKKNKQASPAYNVSIDQNAARLAQTIPVIYGRVIALPDIASQPYSEYLSQNERASMILCLGYGDYDVHDIFLGESRVTDFPTGSVSTWVIPPSVHKQTLGNVETLTGICEDMMTVPEAAGVDLSAPNDPSELAVAANANGGILVPADELNGSAWLGLIPGNKYTISASTGGSVVATYIGIGPNNSAQFDTALPTATPTTVTSTGILQFGTDTKEGPNAVLTMYQTAPLTVGEMIYIKGADAITRGVFQVYAITPQNLQFSLRLSGPGFASTDNTPIKSTQNITVIRGAYIVYTITPYTQTGQTPADPYRWRGWYSLPAAGLTMSKLYLDVVCPSGLAYITDKGDYLRAGVSIRVEVQEIDINSQPIGTVLPYQFQITGATSSPQRTTYEVPLLKTARYRMRVARINDRDQRASKEISATSLASIRARIYHPPGTAAYENVTLIAMQFLANAGLAAGSARRIKVDCTRKLPRLTDGAIVPTTNPADAFVDILENTDYGGARPTTETDRTTLARFYGQWGTTPGFSGIFDQPTTVIGALQAVLAPVAAMPLPIGSVMSCAQDAPRPLAFVFGPETVVANTLGIGYNFDGLDEPDCFEITYNDPITFVERRVFYPAQGVRSEVIELFGCTSQQQATDWARLRWQEKQTNRKTTQFELEAEGYLLRPLDRFGVIIPSIDGGSGGLVTFYDGTNLEVDAPIPWSTTAIHFKNEDGTLSPPYTITARPNMFAATIANGPSSTAVHPSDIRGDATRWIASATPGNDTFFEFSVTNLEPAGEMRVRVTGQQYTTTKYAGTFVEGWTT